MKTLRIAILDDEVDEQERTIDLLKRFSSLHKIDIEYFVEADPHRFLEHDLSDFDLALIDIIMPYDINGFDVSRIIRESNETIAIMFLTKTLNYAINGYEVKAFDYLLKPLAFEDFSLKMTVFLKTLQSKGEKEIVFKSKGSIIKVMEKSIIYIDTHQHYLSIHTKSRVYETRGNIKDIAKELSDLFSCCSNYCIINFLYVDEIQKGDVLLKSGELMKITGKYKKQFLKDFSHYMLKNE